MSRKRRKRQKRSKIQDSSVASNASGAGGSGDRTRHDMPMSELLFSCDKGNIYYYQHALEGFFKFLWTYFWEAKKIVSIPAYDMTKEGWDYINPDLEPAKTAQIDALAEHLCLHSVITTALEYERLYGGSAVVIGTSEENTQNPSEPLKPESLKKGDLRFLRPLSRAVLTATQYNDDPLSESYGKPETYMIRGKQVHESRLLIFDGGGQHDREVMSVDLINYRYDGFGESVLLALYDDIIRSVGSRKAAYQLINNASIMVLERAGDAKLADVAKGAKNNMDKIKEVADQISIYRAAILEKGAKLGNYSASFGSTPELMMSYLHVLSAASDIPAARFLGESPGGLNANGKGELKHYYDSLHAKQKTRLKPQLQKLLPYMQQSEFGQIYDNFTIEFPSLDQPTRVETADINSKNWLTISNALAAGVGDDTWAAAEAIEKGIFINDPASAGADITEEEERDALEKGNEPEVNIEAGSEPKEDD